jgi:hypothetical protein
VAGWAGLAGLAGAELAGAVCAVGAGWLPPTPAMIAIRPATPRAGTRTDHRWCHFLCGFPPGGGVRIWVGSSWMVDMVIPLFNQ